MKAEERNKLVQRLKRIEGQVRGVQRMIDEEQACLDILTQIAAARAALAQVGKAVFYNYSQTCLKEALDEENGEQDALDDLLKALDRLLK